MSEKTEKSLLVIPDDFPPFFQNTRHLKDLEELCDLRIYTTKAGSEDELIERIENARIIVVVRAYTKINKKVIGRCDELELISVVGAGVDNIDLEAAKEAGITVCNTPGANAQAVAEHTIALMMAATHNIAHHDRAMRKGIWERGDHLQLSGKTIGVVGLGYIGSRVARMASCLGMNVLAWTRRADKKRYQQVGATGVSLKELLAKSDVITLHLAQTPETTGLIGRREIELMKDGVILVNTARAALVDRDALIDALKSGKIARAALDVFHTEPLPADDPLVELENAILTPHNAGITKESVENQARATVENIRAFLSGKPVNVVI